MRKYLGSKITAFAAIIVPLFLVCPLLLGVRALISEISEATVVIFFGSVACTFVYVLYAKSISNQLYSWGVFTKDGIKIKTLFSKNIIMEYMKCNGCGIGFYTHGILNSKVGTKIYFIYLSYDALDERFQSNINLWRPSTTGIKVQFDAKLFEYLTSIMPLKQSQMLLRDYNKYFG